MTCSRPGHAKAGAGAFKCSPCAPNPAQRYQPSAAQAECLPCPIGAYANTAFTACSASLTFAVP